MPIVSLAAWNQYLQSHPDAHLLQTGEWGELKSNFGWEPVRIIDGEMGIQILFRKLPLGFTVGYIPKGNVDGSLWPRIDSVCKQKNAIFLKLEPDLWEDQELDIPILSKADGPNAELRTSPHNIQPPRTIVIDIKNSEE